ncbi:hypothetical protein ACIQBJ_03350 [Kitasatospora sp. NPDC088391]|uniref:hypothetical protein n=1 Tax=Kitasatospora sp. NPDC088391 TaxID=3364074 RepID=UPI003809C34D
MKLRALLDEARWTGPEFARAVNAEALESALVTHYDRTNVAHWLAGSRPRGQTGRFLCRALSRRLGREVRPEHVGLAEPSPDPATEHTRVRVDERLRELGKEEKLAGRDPRRLPYVPVPALPDPERWPGPVRGGGRIGLDHVRSAESMVDLFAHADAAFGGGRVRSALASYLSVNIAEYLTCSSSPHAARRLLQAAGDLAYLAGFMAFDENLHGVAQAYFRIAVRLSAESGDPVRHAIAVRQMSMQAHQLKNPRLALLFAEEAARNLSGLPAETAAFVLGQEALALAATGERRRALETLGRAERLLEAADGGGSQLGGYHLAAFTHQQAEVLAAVGDLPAACGALAASLRLRPSQERRARMLTTARLAGLQLARGRLEPACSTWDGFLDDYPQVSSARGDAALRELRRSLRTYRREPAARRLLARAGRLCAADA